MHLDREHEDDRVNKTKVALALHAQLDQLQRCKGEYYRELGGAAVGGERWLVAIAREVDAVAVAVAVARDTRRNYVAVELAAELRDRARASGTGHFRIYSG